jgi:sensor domain CHASE-containing protein
MRGVFIIITLIAMLIVGVLVIKDMQTESVDGLNKKEVIEKAEKTAKAVEKSLDRVKDLTKKATDY